MRETVAIIGSHPRTRAEFDFSRTDCDIWVFNEAASGKAEWVKRCDAVFQMHAEAIWKNPLNRNDTGHFDWLKTQTAVPVYMQDTYPEVPMSVRYPLDEIRERFGLNYFTSSVAYAIALGCHLGYKRIEIYGVEMETNTEYQYQRDGVTLWVGVARGLGIEVDAHMTIFDQPLYGYEGEVVIPYDRFRERIEQLNPHIEAATAEYLAALENAKRAMDAFAKSGDVETEKALFFAVGRQKEIGEKLGMLDGARQENMRYQMKADKMREAAGGEFLFSRQEFESAASNLTKEHNTATNAHVSAATTLDHIHRNVMQSAKNSPKRKKLMEAYRNYLQNYLQTANKAAIYKGAAQENYEYMAWLDKHIKAAGGAKSEAVLLGVMANA